LRIQHLLTVIVKYYILQQLDKHFNPHVPRVPRPQVKFSGGFLSLAELRRLVAVKAGFGDAAAHELELTDAVSGRDLTGDGTRLNLDDTVRWTENSSKQKRIRNRKMEMETNVTRRSRTSILTSTIRGRRNGMTKREERSFTSLDRRLSVYILMGLSVIAFHLRDWGLESIDGRERRGRGRGRGLPHAVVRVMNPSVVRSYRHQNRCRVTSRAGDDNPLRFLSMTCWRWIWA
jgi:hypothetical protein